MQIPSAFKNETALTLRVYEKMHRSNRALINVLASGKDVLYAWNYLRYKGLPIPCFRALSHTDLDFREGDFSGTDWKDSTLTNTNLAKSDLRYARLSYLRATGSSFVEANLGNAAASNMRLTKCALTDVNTCGADTRGSTYLKGQMPAPAPTPLLVYTGLHPEGLSGGVIVTGPRPKAWLSVFREYVAARYTHIVIPRRGEYQTLLTQLRAQPTQTDTHQIHLFDKFDHNVALPHLYSGMPLATLQCFYVPENDNNRKTRSDAGTRRISKCE